MITRTWIRCAFRRGTVGAVTVCLVSMGVTGPAPRPAHARADGRVQATAQPDTPRANEHFLRDAIPATSAAVDPPDTSDTGFTLPEEKSKKQLVKEIAVWVVTAAFIAYFIVKVFIEKDNTSSPPPPSGKPITPPK